MKEDGDHESRTAAATAAGAHNHGHYFHELPMAEEERYAALFRALDKDGNGRIDIFDLSEAIKEFGLSDHYAEVHVLL